MSSGQRAGSFSEDFREVGPRRASVGAGLGSCNGNDRRQWRKQGVAVGAAASKMQAIAKQMLGAATRLLSEEELPAHWPYCNVLVRQASR